MAKNEFHTIIVGAGISGLVAAQGLQRQGLRVLLLEKDERVGGRLASRSLGPGVADTGAQYLTATTPAFQTLLEQWEKSGLLYFWSVGWGGGSQRLNRAAAHPYYAAVDGMQTLAHSLAAELDVRLNTTVVSLAVDGDGWRITDSTGQEYRSDALILTLPAPLSLALLKGAQGSLDEEAWQALAQVRYAPAVGALFWVEGPVSLPHSGAHQRPAVSTPWIVDNQRKGISPNATILTVQGDIAFSRRMWDASETELIELLKAGLEPYLGPTARILQSEPIRWQYGIPETLLDTRCLVASSQPPLICAGDAFDIGGVEGAVLSGLAAADQVVELLAEQPVNVLAQ